MLRRQFINGRFRTRPGDALRLATAFLCLTAAGAAMAQISGNASLVSDYRYRGVSLSQGKPEAQIELDYDSPSGWYAGALASGAKFESADAKQLVAYGGYVGRLSAGVNWEAGASSASFAGASSYNYTEAFAGLMSETYSGRIYFSPNYFDQKTRTVYAEINAAYLLGENLHLLAHGGFLYPLSDGGRFSESSSRYDGRLAVSAKIADWNAQLAWVLLQKKFTEYPQYEDRNPRAVVLSVTYAF